MEIDRGAACDADIDITDVVEKNNELIIEYKLSNIASGCMRSTPRYYAIPIDKKIHTNIIISNQMMNKKIKIHMIQNLIKMII